MMLMAIAIGRDIVESWAILKNALVAFFFGTLVLGVISVVFASIAHQHAKGFVEMDGRGPCPVDK